MLFRLPVAIVRQSTLEQMSEDAEANKEAVEGLAQSVRELKLEIKQAKIMSHVSVIGNDEDWEGMAQEHGMDVGLRHNPLLVPIKEVTKGAAVPMTEAEQRVHETTAPMLTGETKYVRRDIGDSARMRAMSAAEWWVKHDPIGKRIPNALQFYTLGKGAELSTPVPEVTKVLRDFWHSKANKMGRREKTIFRKWVIHGELVLVLIKPDPELGEDQLKLRYREPYEIDEIHRNPKDWEDKWFLRRSFFNNKFGSETEYYRMWNAPKKADLHKSNPTGVPEGAKEQEDMTVGFYVFDEDGDVTGRGLPLMFPVMKHLRFRRDLLIARMYKNRAAAYFFMVRQATRVSAQANLELTSTTPMPKSGVIINAHPDVSYTFISPEIRGGEARPDYMTLMNEICAGIGLPPHILFMDSSDSNYASIRIADTPASQQIEAIQDNWQEIIIEILKQVIQFAIDSNKLSKTIEVPEETPELIGEMDKTMKGLLQRGAKEPEIYAVMGTVIEAAVEAGAKMKTINTIDIPIGVGYPSVTGPDPEKVTDRVDKMVKLGLMSDVTAWEKLGIDPEQEKLRLAVERTEKQVIADEDMERRVGIFKKAGGDLDIPEEPEGTPQSPVIPKEKSPAPNKPKQPVAKLAPVAKRPDKKSPVPKPKEK